MQPPNQFASRNSDMSICCARCGRPVEKVEWYDDWVRQQRIVNVYCHGSKDSMRMDYEFMERLIPGVPLKGVAFQQDKKEVEKWLTNQMSVPALGNS